MNRKADNEQMLADVLAEASPADFRGAMLGQTLRLVRRRRRWRQTRRAAALLVALGICGVFIWQKNLPLWPIASAPAAKAVGKSYHLVQTRPLPAGALVATRPLISGHVVASAATVELVQTRSRNYRVLNDDELLALVGRRPAILIRTGPNSEQLVFANPEDEKGFPLN